MGQGYTKHQKFFSRNLNINKTKEIKTKIKITIQIENADNSEYYYEAYFLSQTPNQLIAKSEKISGKSKNLQFEKFLVFDYFFEKKQKIQISLFKNTKQINFQTSLGNIIGKAKGTLRLEIENNSNDILVISSTEIKQNYDKNIKFQFEIQKKTKIDFSKTKNKFYLKISNESPLYQTEFISDKGKFNPFEIPDYILSNEFSITFFNSNNQPMGKFKTSPQHFINSIECKSLPFPFEKTYVELENKSTFTQPNSFIDHLLKGINLNLTIGIDFTASNHGSYPPLHSLFPEKLNDYETSILHCGEIISDYNYDELFSVFGFGAASCSGGAPNMCFLLNEKNDRIHTIKEVLKEYRIITPRLFFSGPSKLVPLIKEAIKIIETDENKKNRNYHILLILTDGDINDIDDSAALLSKFSSLPFSVLIIGIGNNNFSEMKMLKNSINKQEFTNLRLNFVRFNEFRDEPEKLTSEILKIIPNDVIDYYEENDVISS